MVGTTPAAWPGAGPHAIAEATAWVRGQPGPPHASLTPLTHLDAWRVDEKPIAGQEHGPGHPARGPGHNPAGS